MTGEILSVNISPGGLPKRAVREGFVTPLGIEGDLHAHPNVHGGPRKAVLLIAAETIQDLTEKGYPVFWGALGENLTTRGLHHKKWRAGQRFRAGEALIELTQPRGPCASLDVYGPAIKTEIYDSEVKSGNTASAKWGLSGFYARVVRTGRVWPGAPIELDSETA